MQRSLLSEEDKRVKETVTSRNELESHAYHLTNQVCWWNFFGGFEDFLRVLLGCLVN